MRPIWAQFRAAAHIGQGSTVTYKVASFKYLPPRASVAAVMAIISAWAVGSWRVSVRLCPFPMMRPLHTTTAPMGTSPSAAAARASFKASCMYFSSVSILLESVFRRNSQFLATVTAACSEDAAAVRRAHTLAETVFVHTFAAGGLECPFHIFILLYFRLVLKRDCKCRKIVRDIQKFSKLFPDMNDHLAVKPLVCKPGVQFPGAYRTFRKAPAGHGPDNFFVHIAPLQVEDAAGVFPVHPWIEIVQGGYGPRNDIVEGVRKRFGPGVYHGYVWELNGFRYAARHQGFLADGIAQGEPRLREQDGQRDAGETPSRSQIKDVRAAGPPTVKERGLLLLQVPGDGQRMQDVVGIQIVNVFAGNHIDFFVPLAIQAVQGGKLFLLVFRQKGKSLAHKGQKRVSVHCPPPLCPGAASLPSGPWPGAGVFLPYSVPGPSLRQFLCIAYHT